MWGYRNYATTDDSRNLWWAGLLAYGEGWHNNHHRYPGSARQGFYWYEYDITFYILKVLSWFGLVWKLQPVPEAVLEEGREAGRLLVELGCIDPGYIESMLAREQQANTFLGNGIAIPHGLQKDRELIHRTGVAVVQVPTRVTASGAEGFHF